MIETRNPLNVALIGLGMVADTHLFALADLKHRLILKGIHARSRTSVEAFAAKAEEHIGHAPQKYGSIADIAADSELDFAIIATPPNARREIVEALAASGINILMEKPIERTCTAATEIVELCETQGVKLGVVFQHRVRAASQKLHELVVSGAFGQMRLVEAYVPWWREQAYYDEPGRGTYARDGGGVLISQAIHTLDLMLSLTGTVAEVQAMARTTAFHQMEAEDFVTAGLDFDNGATGSLVASTACFPGAAESITLHFDKAVALLKSGKLEISWRDGRTEVFGADASTGGGADPMAFTHDWHRDILNDFADSITENRAPLASGRDALNVHMLIDALVQSSNQKRAVTLGS